MKSSYLKSPQNYFVTVKGSRMLHTKAGSTNCMAWCNALLLLGYWAQTDGRRGTVGDAWDNWNDIVRASWHDGADHRRRRAPRVWSENDDILLTESILTNRRTAIDQRSPLPDSLPVRGVRESSKFAPPTFRRFAIRTVTDRSIVKS